MAVRQTSIVSQTMASLTMLSEQLYVAKCGKDEANEMFCEMGNYATFMESFTGYKAFQPNGSIGHIRNQSETKALGACSRILIRIQKQKTQ